MDDTIYELITSISEVQNKINGRCSPIKRETDTFPAITFRKVFAAREYNFDGKGPTEQSFDVFIYSKTYSELQEIGTLLENKLSQTSGSFGNHYVEDVRVEEFGNDDWLEDINVYTDRVEIKVRFTGDLS